MPCSDPRDRYNYSDYERDSKHWRARIDEVTQNLCYLFGFLHGLDNPEDSMNKLKVENKRIYNWWIDHFNSDRRRCLKEAEKYILENPDKSEDEVVDWFIKKAEIVHPVSEFHKIEFFPGVVKEAMQSCPEIKRQKGIPERLSKEDLKFLISKIKSNQV